MLALSKTGWPQPGIRQLIFVLTGGLRLEVANATLTAGDMIVVDADIDLAEMIAFDEDSRVLSLHVGDWEPRLADHVPAPPSADAPAREPNFKWLYTGPDGQAYFRPFDERSMTGLAGV